jgi:hypothetical protein
MCPTLVLLIVVGVTEAKMGSIGVPRGTFVRPGLIPEHYCSGLATMELSGPNVRLTYFTERGCNPIVNELMCSLVFPRIVLTDKIMQLTAFAAGINLPEWQDCISLVRQSMI